MFVARCLVFVVSDLLQIVQASAIPSRNKGSESLRLGRSDADWSYRSLGQTPPFLGAGSAKRLARNSHRAAAGRPETKEQIPTILSELNLDFLQDFVGPGFFHLPETQVTLLKLWTEREDERTRRSIASEEQAAPSEEQSVPSEEQPNISSEKSTPKELNTEAEYNRRIVAEAAYNRRIVAEFLDVRDQADARMARMLDGGWDAALYEAVVSSAALYGADAQRVVDQQAEGRARDEREAVRKLQRRLKIKPWLKESPAFEWLLWACVALRRAS